MWVGCLNFQQIIVATILISTQIMINKGHIEIYRKLKMLDKQLKSLC